MSGAGAGVAAWRQVDLSVDYSKKDTVNAELEAVARALLNTPPWADASNPVTVTVISGGITNMLFKVDCSGECILIRVFGAKTEVLIDRDTDNAVFKQLSDFGFGPHFYGTFANGRVEGWIPAKPLEPPEMALREPPRDLATLIARQLAVMHALPMPYPKTPMLWECLAKWHGMASAVEFPDDATKAAKCAGLDLPWVGDQLKWLQAVLPSAENDHGATLPAATAGAPPVTAAWQFLSSVVFCHNDLLSGNLLDVATEARVQFIDFEYGGYNYAGFDIANHFCEYAGFDFDLDKWYPTRDAQLHFLRAYVGDRTPADVDVDAFFVALSAIVNQFALASHFFWGLWAVIQARHSPIDFDFMEYAVQRIGGFKKHKAEFFPGV